MDKKYDFITIISKYSYFMKAWSRYFCDIIKIVTIFVKTITKDSRKVKRIRNVLSKSNLQVYFLM